MKSTISISAVLLAVLAGCGDAESSESAVVPARLRIQELFRDDDVARLVGNPPSPSTITFGPEHMFFSLGAEVYRAPIDNIDGKSVSVVRAQGAANYVEHHGGALFVIDRDVDPDPEAGRALYMSSDEGERFEAIDAPLKECIEVEGSDPFCVRLTAGSMVRKIGSTIYYTAGNQPNVLATNDDGATWEALRGGITENIGHPYAFDIAGSELLVTAELGIDDGFLQRLTLSDDGQSIVGEGVDLLPREVLRHRQGYCFARRRDSKTVFIGMEEGLVRSDAEGDHYEFILDVPTFIHHIAFVPNDGRIVIAGNPKTGAAPYLAISSDGGETWTNLTRDLLSAIRRREGRIRDDAVKLRGLEAGPDAKLYLLYTVSAAANEHEGKAVLAQLEIP